MDQSYRMENKFRSQDIIRFCSKLRTLPSIKFNSLFTDRKLPENPDYETSVDLEGKGTIESLLEYYPRYDKIMVLNMANATRIGGGWLSGAEAQEEYLFRRTDLHKTLTENLYPMQEDEVIFSPCVRVLFDDNYNILDPEHTVSFISVAAVKDPYINNEGELTEYDWTEMYFKIKLIFHIAATNKQDCLILGALGCGAFHNPPHVIATIFAEMCSEYAGYFKKVVFAIKSVRGDANCKIFQQVFLDAFRSEQEEKN